MPSGERSAASPKHGLQSIQPSAREEVERTAPVHETRGSRRLSRAREVVREVVEEEEENFQKFWDRFRGKGREVSWSESLRNIVFSSWLNIFFVILPIAWVSHWVQWHTGLTFGLCFVAILPMARIFDYCGEQMAFYLGYSLGDLVVITLNNAVEATLSIILLLKCQVKLLQSTIAGVVLLHLLLIPGTAFLVGGARIWEQELHEHPTQLNHSLLTIGVLALLLPSAFFSSIGTGLPSGITTGLRHDLGQISRGLALILLIVYIASRIYLHHPPGAEGQHVDAHLPHALRIKERELARQRPEVNVWSCIALSLVVIVLMAVTAWMLVESIEFVQERSNIQDEWFGLVFLPIVSFSADGVVAIVLFLRVLFRAYHGKDKDSYITTLARGRTIDLSIQFTLFWMPFFVLLGWWTDRPLSLLFDMFEVALLLGACFLVNYVTADAKTNWAEGCIMVGFYVMIALCSWFYPGNMVIEEMVQCQKNIL
ncbi:hypothetical protein PUNSTDRAFT_76298 [Punctularia strigosozonata HHB-11173 SS5]|uniref:Sodium/calcium exchanger membrane region domain-containing protein n=1 Tax=Punctularia strigosozonata (strain HHB-11173) TaxID=741275 RepID=R7S1Y6_PUNST|nr:uncharacterized protein PUNSTDRAFT_76298 [Punctularia strigosozonata HHB-11173 SS5]EIN04425.1 hypothetical protein PUNSTDRAFT_76298 [Punctularia strigosozonata HHB-11173 SS5]